MKITRTWAMPSAWTFTIKPIREFLKNHVTSGDWCDPFAGDNSPATHTNDINPDRKAQSHIDALDFLKEQKDNFFDGVLYDPPYSITQARMYGKKEFSSMKYWADCKNEIARILKPGGKAICFGWNSMGIGKTRGFEMIEVLLVPHGGSKNDTICTVELNNMQTTHDTTCPSHPDSKHYHQPCTCSAGESLGVCECGVGYMHDHPTDKNGGLILRQVINLEPDDTITEENFVERMAMNIVYQIGDELEAGTEKRQATNDRCIYFVKKFLESAYLAGARAHKNATRVEKKIDNKMYDMRSNCDSNFVKGFDQAITEVEAKSESFFKELEEGK